MQNNKIQVFENSEHGSIRTVMIDGQPWFVGKDIAERLGYGNYRQALKTNVDEDDKGVHSMDTLGGKQKITLINESGLYSLILSSKLPTAKAFKRWVTSEVLPAIRAHGAYITDEVLQRMQDDSDFIDKLVARLSAEKYRTEVLLDYVEATAPKVRYYDLIMQCPDAVQVTIIAKDYGMTAVAFNKLLHRLGIQFRIGKTWLLYSEHTNKGYTLTKTYLINGKIASIHTCFTQRGRLWLYEVLKKYGFLPEVESSQICLDDTGALAGM